MFDNDSDFTKHNFSFWKWVAWAVITLPLASYVLKSTYDLWPDLIWMAVFSAIAVIGASLYTAVYTTENAVSLRNVALTALGVIELALFVNAAAHGGGARAFENATAAREERQIDENRQLEIQKQKMEAEAKIAEANAKQADSLAKLAQADAAKLDAANRLAKRNGRPVAAPALSPQMSLVAPVEAAPAPEIANIATDADLKKKKEAEKVTSPAEVRDRWFWAIFVGLLLELGAAIGGAYKVTRTRLADKDKNGVADWKEELDPEELRTRFPKDYARIYGESPKETRH